MMLHALGFVERKEKGVFLGPSGVGKTHMAIAMAEKGRRVYQGAQCLVLAPALLREEAALVGQVGRDLKRVVVSREHSVESR